MHSTLASLIDRLDSQAMAGTDVIRWGAPVPAFGDLSCAEVATVGLNPSNREFMDDNGGELCGPDRRFHTLGSLRLKSWSDVDAGDLRSIGNSCSSYFLGNPYDRWFRRLDQIIAGANASYYGGLVSACHLDLIPYATEQKWTDLTFRQRSLLLAVSADTLALLLRDSRVQLLILNGQSVVERFQEVMGVRLERHEMREWTLRRTNACDVLGLGYRGFVDSLCGITLSHRILVLGYNHNIQSSFGVTTQAVAAIRAWVAGAAAEMFH